MFADKALDVQQQLVSGTIAADSPALARHTLRARGLCVADLSPLAAEARGTRKRLQLRLRSSVDVQMVAELWRNLALLLNAGVPLAQALDTCRRQLPGPLDGVLRQIQDAVRGGAAFADAVAAQRALSDPLTNALLRVGDQSGALPQALLELAEHLARRRANTGRLVTALIYPAILCLVGLGVVIFLMSSIVPQLVDVLASADRALPWPTQVLQAISHALLTWGPVWLLAALGLSVIGIVIGRTPGGRRLLERCELAIPVWGALVRKTWLARISLLLATMLKVDVRFTSALRVVRESLGHSLYRDELARLERELEAGAEIAAPLRDSPLIPPLVAHLLAVGQAGGELPQMLTQIRDHYEREVQQATARFLAILEPGLILVLAVVIGFVVYATLLPILETTRTIQ